MKKAMIDHMQKPPYDHFDTPNYAITPLLHFIPQDWTIWEPTDSTGESQIPQIFQNNGNKVVTTDRDTLDFLHDNPSFHFDCIVTNPPYSIKNEFIEKCIAYGNQGKKWALLMPLTALESVEREKLFSQLDPLIHNPLRSLEPTTRHFTNSIRGTDTIEPLPLTGQLGLLIFSRRVEFLVNTETGVWFSTAWFCFGLLPRQLIFYPLTVPSKKRSSPKHKDQAELFACSQES